MKPSKLVIFLSVTIRQRGSLRVKSRASIAQVVVLLIIPNKRIFGHIKYNFMEFVLPTVA